MIKEFFFLKKFEVTLRMLIRTLFHNDVEFKPSRYQNSCIFHKFTIKMF